MINAIAFDLVGVFLVEKDLELSAFQRDLEKNFGLFGRDEAFIAHFSKKYGMSERQIEDETRWLIEELYEIREPELLNRLPRLKFAVATSHQSYVIDWLKTQSCAAGFGYFFCTGDSGLQKTDPQFYYALAALIGEEPEKILFVDDRSENCLTAESIGMRVIHFKRGEAHSVTILGALNTL